jgi:hypothetical protein
MSEENCGDGESSVVFDGVCLREFGVVFNDKE